MRCGTVGTTWRAFARPWAGEPSVISRQAARSLFMDPLHSYAASWLKSHELFSFGYGRVNRAWLSMEESAHPGFMQALKDTALAWLNSPDPDEQQRALRALAALGVEEDLPQVDAFASQASGALQEEA